MIQVFKKDDINLIIKKVGDEILFDAESVGRALGFTQEKNGKTYVKYERMKGYLDSPQLGKSDFIPESAVYLLAFKASNEVAINFQMWLATEVLPSVRANGAYVAPAITTDQESKLLKYGTPLARRNHLLTTPIESLENEIQECMDYNKRKTAQEKVTIRKHMTRLIDERKEAATSTAQKLWLEEVKVNVLKKLSETKSKSYANKLFNVKQKIEVKVGR